MVKRFSLRYTLFLYFSDLAMVVLALYIATEARIRLPFGRPAPLEQLLLPALVYLLAVTIWAAVFPLLNVYAPKRSLRLGIELQSVTLATMLAWLVLTGALYLSYRDVSRLQVIYFCGLYLGLIWAHRGLVRTVFRLAGHEQRYHPRRVLIIGTGPIAVEVARTVSTYAWTGLQLIGFAGEDTPEAARLAPILGPISQITALNAQHHPEEVIIALPASAQPELGPLTYELLSQQINLRVVPDYFELAFIQVRVEDFGGMPLLSLKEPTLDPFQRLTKRAFDLIVTGLLLIPGLPLMAVIALAIKLDSPGPVIFRQQRIGEGGRLFEMLKFRTMTQDAEQRQHEALHTDAAGHILHKRPDDPRVTRVGHFLRRTSLDELPQLINILRGEMSLVGPRPEMPWLAERYEPWQRKRFDVPQGLTGWWQVNGRADKPMHLHTEEDLFYIQNYSLWLDIQILWRTIDAVLSRRGAY